MTGPEHYREAERLADQANDLNDHNPAVAAALAAEAQAHATLALAAATALGVGGDNPPDDDAEAWWRAAGTRDPHPGRPEEDVDNA